MDKIYYTAQILESMHRIANIAAIILAILTAFYAIVYIIEQNDRAENKGLRRFGTGVIIALFITICAMIFIPTKDTYMKIYEWETQQSEEKPNNIPENYYIQPSVQIQPLKKSKTDRR